MTRSTTWRAKRSLRGRWPCRRRWYAAPKIRSRTTSASVSGEDAAPPSRPLHQGLVLGAQRVEHPLPPRRGQLGVSLRLCDEAGQHATGARLAHGAGPGPEGDQKVATEGARVRERELAPELRHERVERQRATRRPAPVDRGFADAGTGGHLLHRHTGQAALGQDGGGGLEDGDVGLGTSGRPALRGPEAVPALASSSGPAGLLLTGIISSSSRFQAMVEF